MSFSRCDTLLALWYARPATTAMFVKAASQAERVWCPDFRKQQIASHQARTGRQEIDSGHPSHTFIRLQTIRWVYSRTGH